MGRSRREWSDKMEEKIKEVFDDKELDRRIKEEFEKPWRIAGFLNRTKVVNCVEGELMYKPSIESIPTARAATLVPQSIINKTRDVKNIAHINSFLDATVAYIVMAIKVNMNSRIVSSIIEEGISTNGDWSNPLTAIRKHLEFIKTSDGIPPDRMTLSSTAYSTILNSEEFKERLHTNYLELSEKKLIRRIVGVYPDVYDDVYMVKKQELDYEYPERVLAENKIIFSNSSLDLNGSVMDFAVGVTGFIGLSKNVEADSGIVGYYGGDVNINAPSITINGAISGIPRIHNREAFSTLTI